MNKKQKYLPFDLHIPIDYSHFNDEIKFGPFSKQSPLDNENIFDIRNTNESINASKLIFLNKTSIPKSPKSPKSPKTPKTPKTPKQKSKNFNIRKTRSVTPKYCNLKDDYSKEKSYKVIYNVISIYDNKYEVLYTFLNKIQGKIKLKINVKSIDSSIVYNLLLDDNILYKLKIIDNNDKDNIIDDTNINDGGRELLDEELNSICKQIEPRLRLIKSKLGGLKLVILKQIPKKENDRKELLELYNEANKKHISIENKLYSSKKYEKEISIKPKMKYIDLTYKREIDKLYKNIKEKEILLKPKSKTIKTPYHIQNLAYLPLSYIYL